MAKINARSMVPIKSIGNVKSDFTQLMVAKAPDDTHHLCFEAQTRNGYTLYMGVLFALLDDELMLDDGRFLNFNPDLTENEVCIERDTRREVLAGGVVYQEYGDYVQEQVQWCRDHTANTNTQWGFRLRAHNVSLLGNHFFFSDPDSAMLFKLVWS